MPPHYNFLTQGLYKIILEISPSLPKLAFKLYLYMYIGIRDSDFFFFFYNEKSEIWESEKEFAPLKKRCHNINVYVISPGTEVMKLFSSSTQLSMKFFLLIHVKMPTIVGILTCMSGNNSILGLSEPKKS